MTIEQKDDFGKALIEARKSKKVTQLSCAKHCGVSIVSYQNWEHGMCEPKKDKMDLICDFLDINKEEFA